MTLELDCPGLNPSTRFESQYKLHGLNPSTSSMTLAKKDLCASVSLVCKMGLVIQLTLEKCRG